MGTALYTGGEIAKRSRREAWRYAYCLVSIMPGHLGSAKIWVLEERQLLQS